LDFTLGSWLDRGTHVEISCKQRFSFVWLGVWVSIHEKVMSRISGTLIAELHRGASSEKGSVSSRSQYFQFLFRYIRVQKRVLANASWSLSPTICVFFAHLVSQGRKAHRLADRFPLSLRSHVCFFDRHLCVKIVSDTLQT